MRESEGVSTYCGLPEQEAFDIEYWLLEEAKLQRMPKPKALAGRVALITGGAGGIGLASAHRLIEEGACACCATSTEARWPKPNRNCNGNTARIAPSLWVDVTDEAAVLALYRDAAWNYGGIDICVSNAGIASAAPIGNLAALWRKNIDILATGFPDCTSGSPSAQVAEPGRLGDFIGSKNALAASPGALAYWTAKAAESDLARCLALECAPMGFA